jgi:hypothetical protein
VDLVSPSPEAQHPKPPMATGQADYPIFCQTSILRRAQAQDKVGKQDTDHRLLAVESMRLLEPISTEMPDL